MSHIKTYYAGTMMVVWLGLSAVAMGQVPSVSGTFYRDLNLNNIAETGEELSGVSLSLFADDGDGVFDANTDIAAGNMVSGVGGTYNFGGLDPTLNYFVYQSAQNVGGTNLVGSVSGLLNPTTFTMMIDAFDDQQIIQGNPINATGASNLTSSSVIGGQRDLYVNYQGGPAEAVLHANPFGLDQVLQFDQSAGVRAVAVVTYDGLDSDMSTTPAAGGLGGLDLSDSEAFSFLAGIDLAGTGESLTLRIFSGTDVSTALVPIPVTDGLASTLQIVEFSQFSGTASFSNVDAIQLELGGVAPSIDAQIGPISLISGTSANFLVAPEPSAGLMGAMSFLGLLATLRRRRQ